MVFLHIMRIYAILLLCLVMEYQLKTIDTRVRQIDPTIDDIKKRVENIENEVAAFGQRQIDPTVVDDIKQRLISTETEISACGQGYSLGDGIDGTVSEIKSQGSSIVENIELLKQKTNIVDAKIDLLTVKMDTFDHKLKQFNENKSKEGAVCDSLNNLNTLNSKIFERLDSIEINVNKTNEDIYTVKENGNSSRLILNALSSKTIELYGEFDDQINGLETILHNSVTNITQICQGAAWGLPSVTPEVRLSPEVQELADMYWAWRLSDMPEFASFVGIHDYDDRLDDLSLGAWQDRNSKCEQLMGQANLLEPSLTDRYDLLNINILKNELQTYMDGYPLMGFTLPLNYMEGIHADLERLVSWMKLEDLEDYNKLLARYQAVPDQIAQIQTLMETGVEMGITNNAISMKGVGAALGRFVVSSVDESPLWQPFVNLTGVVKPEVADVLRTEAEDIILNKVSPAFASLQSYVMEVYVPRPDIAITSIPTGPEMYEQLLRFHTSTDLTADEIHKIGLDEVDRIEGEMGKIVSELGYNLTVPEFSAMIKNDSQFFYDSPEELMAGFEDIVYNRIQPNLPLAFINIPKAELVLVENPSADGPPAFYTAASFDGSRPGVFFVNTELYESQPQYDMMTLSLHEGNPGHHLQGSHSLESPNIPFFRRAMEDRNYGISPSRFPMNTAFIEGWGLYAEAVGFDMEMFEDPYERYGHYSYEAWRAVRLVIDTGMHDLGWSRQEAIDFMMLHTALSDQVVKNEVDRYITWPGQALAYKVGMLKFEELRQRAQDQLGDGFDLRNFHDVLLDSVGPLNIVEEEINTWIAGGGY